MQTALSLGLLLLFIPISHGFMQPGQVPGVEDPQEAIFYWYAASGAVTRSWISPGQLVIRPQRSAQTITEWLTTRSRSARLGNEYCGPGGLVRHFFPDACQIDFSTTSSYYRGQNRIDIRVNRAHGMIVSNIHNPLNHAEQILMNWPILMMSLWTHYCLLGVPLTPTSSLKRIVLSVDPRDIATMNIIRYIGRTDPELILEGRQIPSTSAEFCALLGSFWGSVVARVLEWYAPILSSFNNQTALAETTKHLRDIRVVQRPETTSELYDLCFEFHDVSFSEIAPQQQTQPPPQPQPQRQQPQEPQIPGLANLLESNEYFINAAYPSEQLSPEDTTLFSDTHTGSQDNDTELPPPTRPDPVARVGGEARVNFRTSNRPFANPYAIPVSRNLTAQNVSIFSPIRGSSSTLSDNTAFSLASSFTVPGEASEYTASSTSSSPGAATNDIVSQTTSSAFDETTPTSSARNPRCFGGFLNKFGACLKPQASLR